MKNITKISIGLMLIFASMLNMVGGTDGSGSTLLFVDDHDILYRSGTKRVLHQPVRHPSNPLLVGPDVRNQLAYCSVYRDPASGRYQMWYQVSGDDCAIAYAESADGLKWTMPNLGLITKKGIPLNNLVLTSVEHYGASVVVDPPGSGDPAKRYKMVYWSIPHVEGPEAYPGDRRGPNGGMFVAFSPDGIHWTKHPEYVLRGTYGRGQQPPIAGGPKAPFGEINSVSDVLDAQYDPVRKTYVVYAKAWIDAPDGKTYWKRAIVRTESVDFVQWSEPQLVMVPDENDGVRPWEAGGTRKGVQLHGAPTFLYHGLYLSLLQVSDFETHGLQPIELAVSRDSLNWSRPFRAKPFIPVGLKAQFDAGRIWSNATPIILEDEIRFYYGAYEHPWDFASNPSPWGDYSKRRPKSGLGLAILPRDRFAGVRPMETVGQVTLKPRELRQGAEITVNADAGNGTLRVELLNEFGYRLPGFTKDDAVPITGNGLRHTVKWKSAAAGSIPAGNYMIRLHLDQAEVFAITLK